MEIGTGVATNVINAVIGVVVQQLKDVRELGKNLQLLNTELARMDDLLRHIQSQFEDQQRQLPELVKSCLERINNALEEAKDLILRANRQRERRLGCCLFFSPKIPGEIREWKTRFGELFQQLQSALSIAANTAQIVDSASPQEEVLLQPVPATGFVGSGIIAAQEQLLTWLNEPHPLARVVGVYGMPGVGKTALLRLIYNNYKEVSSIFNLVILYTVSQNYIIKDLQASIDKTLSLNLTGDSNIDMMKLSASLEKKRFLLILDDLWSPIDLDEVGVKFGDRNHSKVLISSRSRNVVEIMAKNEYCMMVQPLSTEEGWELFRRKAFRNGAVPDNNLETIAREVASECNGLPLALNTVAAALARKKTAEDWSRALVLMKNVDPSFPSTHPTIDAELYQRVRLSYDYLPNDLKMCFLYCAAFPEDARIEVETLVEMWTAEGLVPQKGKTYFMDAGREYIDTLVDRCLIEYVDAEKGAIKIHDVLRDMAIYVGQKEENWLFLSGQHLQRFPSEKETRYRKRISVLGNKISDLPPDFECPTLVSLVLAKNRQLNEIPESFLGNVMSLKVLDLSDTSIQALPTTVGQLGQLEFLNLRGCDKLKELPDSICNLSNLQFLNLGGCDSLNSLPDRIGELKNLKHLKFSGSQKGVMVIPHQISQLTSLNKLVLPPLSTPMSVEDLRNLSNLIELDATVKPEIKGGSMSTWSEMRKLRLRFDGGEDDDAALDILPQNIQSMTKLQSLELFNYRGVSLPNCICQFQNFKNLHLERCMKLKELPALEIGNEAARGGFPVLERLELQLLHSLESIVWNAKTMLRLQILNISSCRVLKTFRVEELPNLRELIISNCDEFQELSMESGGGLPMLETLNLRGLASLESIRGWNAKTMLQLQSLYISNCLVLKTFRMEELPNLRELNISSCAELEELFMESGGGLPMLETLNLRGLDSLESIRGWNAKTMPQLKILNISYCRVLKTLTVEELPNLRELNISLCRELKELSMESGGGLPMLETLHLEWLNSLESIRGWNAKTMPQLKILNISYCRVLKTLRVEDLPNLRELNISDCDEFQKLSMESGGGLPMLERVTLRKLHSLESIRGWNAKTMPQLKILNISYCRVLKTLRVEDLPNLRELNISDCDELKELSMESGGGLPMLETLELHILDSLKSIRGWNAKTMPQLKILNISYCRVLKTLRVEELPNLRELNISLCRELKTLRVEGLPNLRKLNISSCAELKELSMESGGGLPRLEELDLEYLDSLESIVWNAKTMLQLQSLKIKNCRVLKTLRVEGLPNLRELNISLCPELKELSMESGGGLPRLERLDLWGLNSLESIVWNAKTMLQLQILKILGCRVLKTFRVEELPNLKEIRIQYCPELKELYMESGGGLPMLETLHLERLKSLESIVWNAKTMLQLQILNIQDCPVLKTFRVEELPNLKEIRIAYCPELEVEIGSVPMLKKLSLEGLKKSESIARASSVWNKETMPELEVIEIKGCPLLMRLPMEMDTLPNLKKIVGELKWWEGISWENENVKIKLSQFFRQEDGGRRRW